MCVTDLKIRVSYFMCDHRIDRTMRKVLWTSKAKGISLSAMASISLFTAALGLGYVAWHQASLSGSGLWVANVHLSNSPSESTPAELSVRFVNVSPFSRTFALKPMGCSTETRTLTVGPLQGATLTIPGTFDRERNGFAAQLGTQTGHVDLFVEAASADPIARLK
jgi:hypothetical protein